MSLLNQTNKNVIGVCNVICLFYDFLQSKMYPFWRHKGTPGYTEYILIHISLVVLSIGPHVFISNSE